MHVRKQKKDPNKLEGGTNVINSTSFCARGTWQALVKPWAAFEAQVPLCGSLRGFIRLHQAYLDLILER